MPHSGGGGHSGGFHSSGGSSGSVSSTPRYDHQGNLHSYYYVRPGFYYRNRFVPYSAKERKSIANYIGGIMMILFSTILIFVMVLEINSKGKYDESQLEEFALDQYSEIYNPQSNDYERNILVTFVAYEDKTQFDYISMVGDNVDYTTDCFFGNQETIFGKALLDNVPQTNYYENLYSSLAESLKVANKEFSENSVYGGNHGVGTANDIHIVNKTNYGSINGESDLLAACNEFYTLRGYNISFAIVDANDVYKIEWPIVIALCGFSLLMIISSISLIIQKKNDIKAINNEIKNGNAAKFYEGEDPFEEYYKNNPLD